MKHLFTLSAFALTAGLAAQITITSNDFGNVGDSYTVGRRNANIIVTPGNAGVNQTWNFTSLTPETLDTINFLAPAGQPMSASFPNANLVIESNDGIFYFDRRSDGIYTHGGVVSVNGTTTAGVYSPEQTLLPFPTNYQDNFTSASGFQTAFPFAVDTNVLGCPIKLDSIRVNRFSDLAVNFDAWGTVQLPTDTLVALRANSVEVATDSIFIYAPQAISCPLLGLNIPQGWSLAPATLLSLAGIPGPVTTTTSTVYTWYANGEKFGVVAMEVDGNGDPVNVRFKSDASQLSVSAIQPNNAVNAFPNPASAYIRLSLQEPAIIEIIDISGRVVGRRLSTPGQPVTIEGLQNGVYFFNATSDQGKKLGTGRFVKQSAY
jgi:hypothetical protein